MQPSHSLKASTHANTKVPQDFEATLLGSTSIKYTTKVRMYYFWIRRRVEECQFHTIAQYNV